MQQDRLALGLPRRFRHFLDPTLRGGAQIARSRIERRHLRRRLLPPSFEGPGVGTVVDEAVGRVGRTEIAAPAEADAHRGPIVGLRHVHDRDRLRYTTAPAAGPIGMIDQHFPPVDHARHDGDVSHPHMTVGAERQDTAGFGGRATGIDPGRIAPPLPSIAGDNDAGFHARERHAGQSPSAAAVAGHAAVEAGLAANV